MPYRQCITQTICQISGILPSKREREQQGADLKNRNALALRSYHKHEHNKT